MSTPPDASRPETRSTHLPIAWVVPGPLRQLTGGYIYDARIVDGLRARGRRVGVVNLRAGGWPLDWPAARRLERTLSAERWAAVVVDELAHPVLAAAIVSGRLRAMLGRAPLVLLVHHLRYSEPGPRVSRLLASLVERLVLRAADLIVCTSGTTAQTVRSLAGPQTRVEVVRPGWDTHDVGVRPSAPVLQRAAPSPAATTLTPNPSPRGRREQPPLPLGEGRGEGYVPCLRALMVAHWTPRKRVLDALAAVRLTSASVTLDLVGQTDRDPSYAARVRYALRAPELAGRVRAHGQVSSGRLAELYASADALLLCSSHEGYGMVLAEGLAAGLPIIATRVGAVPDVVRDGCEADLVEPGNSAELAHALERLARDPAERVRRSALARERASLLPTWEDGITAFDELLHCLTRPAQ